jgi:S1-C subfamily serine protease
VDTFGNDVYPISIVATSSEVGERVIVIGNPLGLEQTVSDGIVSAVRKIPNFGRIIQITAPISPGSSGSPVVNMQGEVIRN